MTVCAVLASLISDPLATGIGSDVMKPIAAPMVGGMIHFDHPRADFGARILCVDEGTCVAKRLIAT